MNFTIGIITDGKQTDRVNLIIDSLNQIPNKNKEIIVVGGSEINRGEKHISFDESQKAAHITKKKNLIAQNAKFNNLLILHDYVILDKDWYSNFVTFGEDWDVCMNPIINTDGTRWRDWVYWKDNLYYKNRLPHPLTVQWKDYDDSSNTHMQYVSGTVMIIKKDFLIQNPLDEKLGHSDSEDVVWSLNVRNFWNYKMNKYSKLKLLKEKPLHPPKLPQYGWNESYEIANQARL